jgi:hypothetical protein
LETGDRYRHAWSSALNRRLSDGWCFVGWLAASIIFIGGTQLIGGPTSGDAADSLNTTWAISHGALSCAYAPRNQFGLPFTGPLYPWISGGLAALVRIGHRAPFPTSADFGAHCATAVSSMYYWTLRSGALKPTLLLGYAGWFVLLVGVITILRRTGRGRSGWEPLTVILLAIVPPVFMSLREYFHPQDLLAMGLILCGVACAQRGAWFCAGICLGLAFTSQQFTLLALAPLAVIAPKDQLAKLTTATLGAVVVVMAPLALFAPRASLAAVLTGSGTTWTSATILDLTHLSGPLLFLCSRFVPIAAAMLLAWWAQHRLGAALLEPIPLLSLIATSLSLRLVLEVNLWGYYFMAVAVAVLLVDVLRGQLRLSYFAWLILIVLAFRPVIGANSSWAAESTWWLPLWAWQLVLAPGAVYLAFSPLAHTVKSHRLAPVPG